MSDIDLSPPQRDLLREKLYKYCQELGPMFYNAGIDAAIATHLAWSDRIQEEMDLKKVY